MRKISAVVVLVFAVAGYAQVQLMLPAVSPEDILQWLQQSTLPAAEKAVWLRILPKAFDDGLVDPKIAQVFFQRLVNTPPTFIGEITAIMQELLAQGLSVTHLMNKVSQGIIMGRPWTVITNEIRLRASVLAATHANLSLYRPMAEAKASVRVKVGTFEFQARTPTWEDVEVEIAEAISDFIAGGGDINDWSGMETLIRTRLLQLRGRGLPSNLVDHVLQVLTPQLIGEIVSQAFQIERR